MRGIRHPRDMEAGDMRNRIDRLNPEFLDAQWGEVAGFLGAGLLCAEGELDLAQLRMLIATGRAQVFVMLADDVITGALAIEPVQYPNFRAANVISAGGKGIYNAQFWALFQNWLKSMGYSKVQGYCPPTVARLLRRIKGFRTSYELVRADL